jgi:hypothetical protein
VVQKALSPSSVRAAGGQSFTPDQVAAMLRAVTNGQISAGQVGGLAVPLPRSPYDNVPFGPGTPLPVQPINPVNPATGRAEPRQYNYPVSWNLPGIQDRIVPFSVLRAAADQISLFRRCIEIRKTEVGTLAWDIVLSQTAIERAMAERPSDTRADVEKDLRNRMSPLVGKYVDFWMTPDRRNGLTFVQWANKVLEDYFVLDGIAIYPRRTRGGDMYSFEVIDGTTIKPLLDQYGNKPAAPNPAYQQILQGFPRGEFIADLELDEDGNEVLANAYGTDQLIYFVHNVRSFTPYGYSAVEQALDDGDLYLRRHQWLKAEYTDGVMPAGWLKAGEGQAQWSPQQLAEYERALNDYYAGQTDTRQRFRILPWGMEPDIRNDLGERYKPDYDLHLITMTASHFDTMIAEIGYTQPGGLGSTGWHEGQENVQDRKATRPTVRRLQSMITNMSRHYLDMPKELEFKFLGLEEEDEDAQDEVANRRVMSARMTINEDRDRLGLARFTFPEADKPFISTPRGIVFMEGAGQVAPGELITPGNGLDAPLPGRDLGGAAGQTAAGGSGRVLPQGKPRYALPPPPDADGNGVDDANERKSATTRKAQVADEIAAYRRYLKKGKSRQFEFHYAAPADLEAAGLLQDPADD